MISSRARGARLWSNARRVGAMDTIREVRGQGPGWKAPLRGLALRLWVALLLAAGLFLLVLTVAPNMSPVAGVLNAAGRPVGLDFIALYSAGTLMREGRAAAAYDDRAISAAESANAGRPIRELRWPYPPGNLPLAGLLAHLPYLPALGLWLGAGLLGLALAARALSGRLAAALLLPLVPGVAYDAMTGQTGIAAAALAGGGFALLPRRPALAGALFGCLTLKPQLALLLPVCLLAGRQWRALLFMLASGAALELLGIALGGPGTVPAFLAAAGGMLDRVAGSTALAHRVPTVFIGLLGAGAPAALAWAGQALASVAAAAAVWRVWRRTEDPLWRCLAWASGAVLAVPYVFDYDLAILALPVACFAARPESSFGWREALAVTLLWSLPVLVSPVAAAVGLQLGALAVAALLAYALQGAHEGAYLKRDAND